MRFIKTHKSRSIQEIAEILCEHGSYSACTLPHYRYRPSREACGRLHSAGLVFKSGKTDISVNYKPTDLLKQWWAENKHVPRGGRVMPDTWAKRKRQAEQAWHEMKGVFG